MDDQNGAKSVSEEPQQWTNQTPKIADALRRGSPVSVTTWGGRELSGRICDWEQAGLLLDVHETDARGAGYLFLPWSSIEQVAIQGVSQRRVKFLPS